MDLMGAKELSNINSTVTYTGNLGNVPSKEPTPLTAEQQSLNQALSEIPGAARNVPIDPVPENPNILRPEEIPILFDAIGVRSEFNIDDLEVGETSSTVYEMPSSRDSDDTDGDETFESEEESDTEDDQDPSNNGGNNSSDNASHDDDHFDYDESGSDNNDGDIPMNNSGENPPRNDGANPPNTDNAGLNINGAGPTNSHRLFNDSQQGSIINEGPPLFDIVGDGAIMNENVTLFSIGEIGIINTEVPGLFHFSGIGAMKNDGGNMFNAGGAGAINNDVAHVYNAGEEGVVSNDVPDIYNMGGAEALNNEADFFNIGAAGAVNHDGHPAGAQFNAGENLPRNNAEILPIVNGHHLRNMPAGIEDEESNISNDTGIVELDDIQFDMREIFDLFAVDYPGLVGAWQHLDAVNDPRAPAPRFIFRCQADVKAFLWHVLEMYNMQEHNLMFNVEVFSLLMCAVMRGGADKRHLLKLIKAFLHNDMSEVFRIVDFRAGWENMPDIRVYMDDDEDSGAEEAFNLVGNSDDEN